MQYSNAAEQLTGAEQLLEIRFRSCEIDGLILYATSSEDVTLYFAIALYKSNILIDFQDASGLKEV